MADRKYYLMSEDKCLFESMTKEQILTAIEQAVSTGEIKDVNTGFITRIREENRDKQLEFWVGTEGEYNAIKKQDGLIGDCLYIITDDKTLDDISSQLNNILKKCENLQYQITEINSEVKTYCNFLSGRVYFHNLTKGDTFGIKVQHNPNLFDSDIDHQVFVLPYSRAPHKVFCSVGDITSNSFIIYINRNDDTTDTAVMFLAIKNKNNFESTELGVTI